MFSTKYWLTFMDKLTPTTGLLVYYVILTCCVLILEYFGLIISGIKYITSLQTVGTMLIIYSFFIVVSWTSCYVNVVIKGDCKEVSNVYLQSEDGSVYYFWSQFFEDVETRRILTYVVTPFILTFIGQLLITNKVQIF